MNQINTLDVIANPIFQETLSTEAILSFFGIMLIFIFAIIIPLWKIFKKTGKEGYESLIPFHVNVVIQEIIGKPKWWVFALLLPNLVQLLALLIIPSFGIIAGGIISGILMLIAAIIIIVMTGKVIHGLGKSFGQTKNFVHIFYSLPIIFLLLSVLFIVINKVVIVATILYIAAILLLLMILPILGYGKSEYVKVELSDNK